MSILFLIQKILELSFLGNHVKDYLDFLLFILIGIIILRIFERDLLKRLKKWAETTETTIDDFLVDVFKRVLVPLGYVGVIYFSFHTLKLPAFVNKSLSVLAVAILVFFGAKLATTFFAYAFKMYWQKRGKDIKTEKSLVGLLRTIDILVWGLAVMLFLDNIGVKISAIVAGLGIGGVAVALAAQKILGDLFSYFSILFDHTFEIGDFITVDDYQGTVEHIGIKTTRLISTSGEQLIFSNSDLTSARVRNFKKMEKRRVAFELKVPHQTPLEKLKEIPSLLEGIIKSADNGVIFDHAHLMSYGDFGLIYEVVYYIEGSDKKKYFDVHQKVNFAIKEAFEKRQIEFATPPLFQFRK
ncbi:MAG: mechanosensitive ion channel family protein [Candidatus Omnitrophica bacterium]|nr:mechanosensitive ion channel family protein [Candidatus Omnitrophota bacterium]